GTSSLLSGNPSENRTDGHSEPGEITLAQNIAGHDFTGSENVAVRSKTLNFGSLVHLHAEIRERNSRAQRIAVKRRLVDSLGPMRLRRGQTGGVAIIKNLVIEGARADCVVELGYRRFDLFGTEAQT